MTKQRRALRRGLILVLMLSVCPVLRGRPPGSCPGHAHDRLGASSPSRGGRARPWDRPLAPVAGPSLAPAAALSISGAGPAPRRALAPRPRSPFPGRAKHRRDRPRSPRPGRSPRSRSRFTALSRSPTRPRSRGGPAGENTPDRGDRHGDQGEPWTCASCFGRDSPVAQADVLQAGLRANPAFCADGQLLPTPSSTGRAWRPVAAGRRSRTRST